MHRYDIAGATVLAAALCGSGCSANATVGEDYSGAGGSAGQGATGGFSGGTSGTGGDAPFVDASTDDARFGPDGGCGYATIPTEREPGSLLFVVDRSYSMTEDPRGQEPELGDPTKADLVYEAMQAVLPQFPPDARVGLILYPSSSDGCDVDPEPAVDIAPMSVNGPALVSWFKLSPWGNTPTDKALLAAYEHLRTIPGSGNKGVMLLTDGAWNCGSNSNTIYQMVEDAFQKEGMRTFAIGIKGAATDALSHLAHRGGADRIPGCNPDLSVFDPQHPFQDNSCGSNNATCCHYQIGASSFVDEMTKAVNEIASRFLTSCVFLVPKDTDPSKFQEGLVNVYVDGLLVPQDPDDGWSYVGGGTDALEIHGELCDQLLSGQKDKVEIELGCPTVVK
jgi:hypothetical protein